MQNYVDRSLAAEMSNATSEQKVDALFNYMEKRGQSFYDEVVTQLEHALQCAALAQQNNASPTLIVSALLHDLGHIILDEHNADKAFLEIDLNHEEIGAQYLAPFFQNPSRPRFGCMFQPSGISVRPMPLIMMGYPMLPKRASSFRAV